ncbi:MAG TPA: NAD-binding protein, partial [Pirellulales bacterium]|nr:NAD-binding protein [Pirellulales bacterium]
MSKLIIGCGYLGGRVARRWRDAGEQVFVVTRDSEHARSFAREGYTPIVADVVRPASLVHLPATETV